MTRGALQPVVNSRAHVRSSPELLRARTRVHIHGERESERRVEWTMRARQSKLKEECGLERESESELYVLNTYLEQMPRDRSLSLSLKQSINP